MNEGTMTFDRTSTVFPQLNLFHSSEWVREKRGGGDWALNIYQKPRVFFFARIMNQNAKLIVFVGFCFFTQPVCCCSAIPEFIAVISSRWGGGCSSSLLPWWEGGLKSSCDTCFSSEAVELRFISAEALSHALKSGHVTSPRCPYLLSLQVVVIV